MVAMPVDITYSSRNIRKYLNYYVRKRDSNHNAQFSLKNSPKLRSNG